MMMMNFKLLTEFEKKRMMMMIVNFSFDQDKGHARKQAKEKLF
jgi:hypothetical protein